MSAHKARHPGRPILAVVPGVTLLTLTLAAPGLAAMAFTLVRRARQVVWIGVGVVILMAIDASRFVASQRLRPVPSGGD
jgi:hypothetical protein